MAIYERKLHLIQEPDKRYHGAPEYSQEVRNRYTGLPEQAFYRPPDPKNVVAAKNALGILFLGFLFAVPFWLMLTEEWSHILRNIEKAVAK